MSTEAKAIAAIAQPVVAASVSFFQRIWPMAVLALGVILTVGWSGVLGYGILELAKLAF
jgi:hypothetical protein